MSDLLDRVRSLASDLGQDELTLQRKRKLFYQALAEAYAWRSPEGRRNTLRQLCEAAGISRQRLYQVLGKTKIKEE